MGRKEGRGGEGVERICRYENLDRGVSSLENTATLLQGPRAKQRQTWLIPHTEFVDRNLAQALMSEQLTRKRGRRAEGG